MSANIKVSGKIISELSDKIPSNIVAINELIKNAYDVGASKVVISLNTTNHILTISDDGSGMDESDINKLFHISNSEKRYGELNQYGRITQGSKGLGFLSVFKFGDKVTWKTKKGLKGLQFSASKNDIINTLDIANYPIDIHDNSEVAKGTIIEINVDDYNLQSLMKQFTLSNINRKLVNSLRDNNFMIEIIVDKKIYSNEIPVKIKDELPDRQTLYITYDSSDGKISFFYKNYLVKALDYPIVSTQFEVNIELMIFTLKSYDASRIDAFFHNPYNPTPTLTPLIYINSNLFSNYSLFDPNLMRAIKTSKALPQMIGFINIISDDSMMDFNSDRTQFLQNQLTDEITLFLSNINNAIQTEGSRLKRQIESNFVKAISIPFEERNATVDELRNYIDKNYEFKDQVVISKNNDVVTFTIFDKIISIPILPKKNPAPDNTGGRYGGNHNGLGDGQPKVTPGRAEGKGNDTPPNSKNVIPAIIQLKQKTKRVRLNSEQIELLNEIVKATDSRGNDINKNSIAVKADGVLLSSAILPSILAEKIIEIHFGYVDPLAGAVSALLTIEAYQPMSKMTAQVEGDNLFKLPTKVGYAFNIDNTLSSLYSQLQGLSIDDNLEVIACCLRPIFEVGIDAIEKSGKFQSLIVRGRNIDGIVVIIKFINSSNGKFLASIHKKTGIDFNSLKNNLAENGYIGLINLANLGAHKSTMYLTEQNIRHLIHKMNFFIIVVNEMLTNPEIT